MLAIAENSVQRVSDALSECLAAAIERVEPRRSALGQEDPGWARFVFSLREPVARTSLIESQGHTWVRGLMRNLDDYANRHHLPRARAVERTRLDPERFWGEPLAMLITELDEREAESVFQRIAPVKAIARRALVAADSATADSIRRVLEEQTDEEDRGTVILEIPRLIQDRQQARELLEELGTDPRVRADLYFLDLAWARLAELAPGLAEVIAGKRRAMLLALPVEPSTRIAWAATGSEPFFRMSVVTVTQAEYRAFDPTYEPGHKRGLRLPAIEVSWYAATVYARWLGWIVAGEPGGLPTETEWEHACRAGTPREWGWWTGPDEKDLERAAWFGKRPEDGPFEVGGKDANPWGFYDVHGNVWEWCSDLYEGGPRRVVRGGCYVFSAASCRSAFRSRSHPGSRSRNAGFRVVLPAARG